MYPGFCNGNFGFGFLGGWGWIIGVVIMVAFLIGVVLLITWLVRRIGSQTGRVYAGNGPSSGSAREVLQVRYASGEITRDEYLEILKDLDG
jgi:putative membrane protein